MAKINLKADEDVLERLDADYVEKQLGEQNVEITFSCRREEQQEDTSWITDEGTPAHLVILPYARVKKMSPEKAGALMLARAKEIMHPKRKSERALRLFFAVYF